MFVCYILNVEHYDFNFYIVDKAAQTKLLYDSKILAFNDTEWRPDAWLSFLMTGVAAGPNALVTMIPRVDPNSLVLTQKKAVQERYLESHKQLKHKPISLLDQVPSWT